MEKGTKEIGLEPNELKACRKVLHEISGDMGGCEPGELLETILDADRPVSIGGLTPAEYDRMARFYAGNKGMSKSVRNRMFAQLGL